MKSKFVRTLKMIAYCTLYLIIWGKRSKGKNKNYLNSVYGMIATNKINNGEICRFLERDVKLF